MLAHAEENWPPSAGSGISCHVHRRAPHITRGPVSFCPQQSGNGSHKHFHNTHRRDCCIKCWLTDEALPVRSKRTWQKLSRSVCSSAQGLAHTRRSAAFLQAQRCFADPCRACSDHSIFEFDSSLWTGQRRLLLDSRLHSRMWPCKHIQGKNKCIPDLQCHRYLFLSPAKNQKSPPTHRTYSVLFVSRRLRNTSHVLHRDGQFQLSKTPSFSIFQAIMQLYKLAPKCRFLDSILPRDS